METKTCNTCRIAKPVDSFEKETRKGRIYIRSKCKNCKDSGDYARTKETGRYRKRKIINRKRRHDPKNRAKFILQDSRWSDKVSGYDNDLDVPFIELIIKDGCSYCGDKSIKIGVDRIDNNRGHCKDNVVSACTRCNFIRRNMPYDVWMMLVPAIKEAFEKGMMDHWNYGFRRHYEKNKYEVEQL